MQNSKDIIKEQEISGVLEKAMTQATDRSAISDVLFRAKEKQGLSLIDAAALLLCTVKDLNAEILSAAGKVRRDIYGERLVLFAPLYISNYCVNDCEYCGFRARSTAPRTRLSTDEIERETEELINAGHKRLLLECGEDDTLNPIDYVVEAIDTIYKVKVGSNWIRRINVNIAPSGVHGFKRLKKAGIGTYQLFQETYHRETYAALHTGPKADYERQFFAHDQAFEAGIDDVGLGVLFGLYDYRFEVCSILKHAFYLERKFGVGPHTVSVPRLRQADGVTMSSRYKVSDDDLLKIIAVIRLTLPYTGIILSTRESAAFRGRAFKVGVTQASAGSVAAPGGYARKDKGKDKKSAQGYSQAYSQFRLADNRTAREFIKDAINNAILPSFCTACYRRGRTGEAFMELAKPGDIQAFCSPNAILTLKEYLEDFAAPDVRASGDELIEKHLRDIRDTRLREETEKRINRIKAGARDLFF